jgi:hypothetical protein
MLATHQTQYINPTDNIIYLENGRQTSANYAKHNSNDIPLDATESNVEEPPQNVSTHSMVRRMESYRMINCNNLVFFAFLETAHHQ